MTGSASSRKVSILRVSLPVAFGYIPLGMAFGLLFAGLGYPWYWASIMSILVFAGSAQFLAVSLLAAGAQPYEAFIATLLLNLRHIFYGLSLMDRYRAMGHKKLYPVFGLTDETFSLLISSPQAASDSQFIIRLTAINQFWWVLGSTLGVLLGKALPFTLKGLEFSLTALFAVLFLDQIRKKRSLAALGGAVAAAALCLAFLPASYFLIASIGMASIVLMLLPDSGEGPE